MKALVAVKRVVDYNVKVRVKTDGSSVDVENAKMSMNPFDEVAVEEAIRLKESGILKEVVVISLGVTACEETLRNALAMGVDRAIHIETQQKLEPLAVAKLLAAVSRREQFNLYLLGKQAIDDDANQTAQMLAALLDIPQGTFVSGVKINGQQVEIVREVDDGLETLLLNLPAVISVELNLNEPRYVRLPGIMAARKKVIEKIQPEELGVDFASHILTLSVSEPKPRPAGVRVSNVAELVAKLKNEAKVI